MKVLCFGRFYDDVPGGMQRHVEHLFYGLKGAVDYVHLVPSRDRHGAQFELHGFPVIRTPSLNLDGSLALSPGLITEALRLQRRHHFDVIHLHFPDPMSHLASMALPASIPRVISWHADITRQKTLLRFYGPWLRRAVDSAAALIVATPHHIESSPELSRLAGSPRLHQIPYGFDLARYLAPAPDAAGLRARYPGRRLIFALGRHVYYKGFDVLIRAMAAVDDSADLIIGGVGPLTQQWRELAAELNLAQRIHFVGMVAEEDLPAYYQAADIFCLPAVNNAEAFGIVQVEAMASACPVVSTRLPSGVSYVNRHEESGLLVEPGNVDQLSTALNRLLRDEPLHQRLGQQARARAVGEFSVEVMAARTLDVYRSVLAG